VGGEVILRVSTGSVQGRCCMGYYLGGVSGDGKGGLIDGRGRGGRVVL
jgi:hypothetical protein